MTQPHLEPLAPPPSYSVEEMRQRSRSFLAELQQRRTVRDFSPRDVDPEVIENCVRTAATAPSGANFQPWHFAIVRSPEVKQRIREAAEEEERAFYETRAPQQWLDALAPLGTDSHKPFLEIAPALIVIFAQTHGTQSDGSALKHYYVSESVGIATGMLITALHHVGLATLTHTPSPMRFLNEILGRPSNERPFLVLVVGHPSEGAEVPKITKKGFHEYTSIH